MDLQVSYQNRKEKLHYIGQTVSEATVESYVGVNLFRKEKDQAIDM